MAKKINELNNISALTNTCAFITQDEGADTQVTCKVDLATLLTYIQNGIIFPTSISEIIQGDGINVSANGNSVTLSAKLGEGLEFDSNGNIAASGSSGAGGIYTYIRYADSEPTSDSDIKTEPSDYMGIYSGVSETAPTSYTAYKWYKIKGENGNGIVSIEKTGTVDNVDTYTITYSDLNTSTFSVTNGKDGEKGKDGETGNGIANIEKTSSVNNVDIYTITFTDNTTTVFNVTNGIDGENGNGIVSVEKTGTVDNVDTYDITFTDGTATSFDITNGVTVIKSEKTDYTCTFTADGWSKSMPYTQTVLIAGMTAEINPRIDVIISDTISLGLKEEAAFACVTRGETGDGTITLYCYDEKPSVDLNVMIEVV